VAKPKRSLPATRWPTRKEAQNSLVFAPIQVGSFQSLTRSWVPAMVPWRATEEGEVTPEVLEWYGRLADGQPGVLVVEATGVRDVPSGPLLRVGDDRFIPGLQELVRTVREHSAGRTRLVIQILDFLPIRRRPEKHRYLLEFLNITQAHRDAVGATADEAEIREQLVLLDDAALQEVLSPREWEALNYGYRERVGDLHLETIRELPNVLPDLFAAAAQRARQAGFDGVELHMAHAYTLASFLSALNQRDDGYGSNLTGRQRLPLEVLTAVRGRVGKDWTVGCRILGDEVVKGGSTIEDACSHALALAKGGMDYISVSKGGKFEDARQPAVGQAIYPYTGASGEECMPTVTHFEHPFGRNLHLSHSIRETLRKAGHQIPVIGAGGIGTHELAEKALREGDCDLVGAARQSLADPDWWLKVQEGRGEEVRRCIYTNYCEGLDQKHRQVTCQLWDRSMETPDAKGGIRLSIDGKRRLNAPPWER
jgi:2,4-dienoyl-CoA reductase-like NADH-dependent reductase (Old Yellow Enzyme family)